MSFLFRKLPRRRALLAPLAAVLFILLPIAESPATEVDASQFVRSLGDELLSMLSNNSFSPKDRDGAFRRLFIKNVDVEFIARLVIGRYWRNSNDKDRQEYLQLFEDFFVKSYAARLSTYSGEAFSVKEMRVVDERDSIVSSLIERPSGGTPLHIDWRLRRHGDDLKIIDVTIEGISMVLTQREEFSAVIQRNNGSIAPLNDLLRQRILTLN